ncbi:hypothetical protein XELAEV_18047576mg [Xenopus laevis]|uniref:Uncharacterized protein n=1 Tax=Xenopus laevis TaxID=8355 RepID=A0A974H1K3_XENLA|nr:hypothetical protein XELAEV_18047576mg [Xenopus laevis]
MRPEAVKWPLRSLTRPSDRTVYFRLILGSYYVLPPPQSAGAMFSLRSGMKKGRVAAVACNGGSHPGAHRELGNKPLCVRETPLCRYVCAFPAHYCLAVCNCASNTLICYLHNSALYLTQSCVL